MSVIDTFKSIHRTANKVETELTTTATISVFKESDTAFLFNLNKSVIEWTGPFIPNVGDTMSVLDKEENVYFGKVAAVTHHVDSVGGIHHQRTSILMSAERVHNKQGKKGDIYSHTNRRKRNERYLHIVRRNG